MNAIAVFSHDQLNDVQITGNIYDLYETEYLLHWLLVEINQSAGLEALS